jgi:hypothetical protein
VLQVSSDIDEWEEYLAGIEGQDLPPVDLCRVAAERGWGPMASTWLIKVHCQVGLGEAKMLTGELCSKHGLREIYEAACKARDPDWPHS